MTQPEPTRGAGGIEGPGTLFELPPIVPEPDNKPSADQQRTYRRKVLLASGVHPATKVALLDGERTYAECRHRLHIHYHTRSYNKCEVSPLGLSHSTASDIRISWPACVLFEAET